MKSYKDFPEVFLFRPFVDMRKQINGLSAIVQSEMKLNPYDDALFVFTNKRRELLKCLYWDRSGFAMWVKRLDVEKFIWPKHLEDDVIRLTDQEMAWLLQGIKFWVIKGHKTLHYDELL